MSKRPREESDNDMLEILGTPRGVTSVSDANPTRRTRIEEKNHLQRLNKRLKYYIFCQREREASTGHLREELENIREQAQKDIEDLRKYYESQMNNATESNEKNATDVVRFRGENERLAREYQNTKQDLNVTRDENAKLQSQLNDREAENRTLAANVLALEDKLNTAERELALVRQKLSTAEADLADARDNAADMATSLSTERLRIEQLLQDLKLNEQRLQSELEHTQKELEELLRDRNNVEEQLRKEFVTQLRDHLADKQAKFDQEKRQLANDLRKGYELQMSRHQADFNAMKQDLEDALEGKNTVEQEIKNLNVKLVSIESANQGLKGENQKLTEQLNKQAAEHRHIIDQMVVRFNELREVFLRKEEEFDNLMDVKITLAMEIKRYRSMLEDEEIRLGIRRSFTTNQLVDKTEKISVVGLDLDGTYIKMKNGATEDISLKGWTLKSVRTNRVYDFPDITVAPGQMLTLFFGPDAEKKAKEAGEMAFAVTNIFAPHGDSGLILDDLGIIANKVEFLSSISN